MGISRGTVSDDIPPPIDSGEGGYVVLLRRPAGRCPIKDSGGKRCAGKLYAVPPRTEYRYAYAGDWRRTIDWERHLNSGASLFCPHCGYGGTERGGGKKIPAGARPHIRAVPPRKGAEIPLLREFHTVWWPMGVDLRSESGALAVRPDLSGGGLRWRVTWRTGRRGRPKTLGVFPKFADAFKFGRRRRRATRR